MVNIQFNSGGLVLLEIASEAEIKAQTHPQTRFCLLAMTVKIK
ncbi:hypothetical protein cce_1149 [Crocosphaera subtropica ATCC 51142]|uniref:Uncharacterized protein n=1 Tax=Crocosphaera subtropica (strain ATCC 51142 / BH68) TaxID=43989 RepID=B1WUP8_CROS5|nr:hypothetical protein cce_1149 [Crocosphaera subtropica ATCC 51142]